jgi:hypothetical protein
LKYPPKDCLSPGTGFLFREYGSDNGETEMDLLPKIKADAKEELEKAYEHKSRELAESHPGYLQCYCDIVKKKKLTDEKNEITTLNFNEGKKGTKPGKGEDVTKEVSLCNEYLIDSLISKVAGQSVAFFIIAINTILKMIIIKLIEWTGEDTFSKRLTSITNMVFVAQFFNTGILLLLVNANLSEHTFIPGSQTILGLGQFYDYSPQWYVDVGFKLV